MDIFVILVSAFFATVKSDVGLGYQYRPPATSYEVPFGSVGNLNPDRKYYHVPNQSFRFNGVVPTVPTVLSSTVQGQGTFGGNVHHADSLSPTIASLVGPSSTFGGSIHQLDNVSPTISSLIGTPVHEQNAFVERQNFEISNLLPTTPSSILQTPIHEHTPFVNIESAQKNIIPESQLIDHRSQLDGISQKKTSFPESQGVGLRSRFDAVSQQSFVNKPVPESQLIDLRSGFNSAENLVHDGPIPQDVEVQKHLYFYSAPDEPEEISSRVIAPPAASKKNVKILFIKAPTFKFAPVQIPSQLQNEEKTLVYVLVKKPDEPEHIIIPTPASSKPTKPEVFFIKYKTQKEAENAISDIQNHGSGGHGAISSIEGSAQFDTRIKTEGVKSDINQNDFLTSRILPTPSGALPSDGDFSHLNINGEYVYNGLRKGNEEINPTLAPDTYSEQFSTITNLVNEKVNEFGTGSTTASPLNLGSSTVQNEVRLHQVYGPPQKR